MAVVVPLLSPPNRLAKVVPSVEPSTTKWLTRVSPWYQAIPIVQTSWRLPRSAVIHDPVPWLLQRVVRSWSSTFAARFPSSPLAWTARMRRAEHVAVCGGVGDGTGVEMVPGVGVREGRCVAGAVGGGDEVSEGLIIRSSGTSLKF